MASVSCLPKTAGMYNENVSGMHSSLYSKLNEEPRAVHTAKPYESFKHKRMGSQNSVVAKYDPLIREEQLKKNDNSRLAAPFRSNYSRLSSFNYNMEINPKCNIKALKSKNLGS